MNQQCYNLLMVTHANLFWYQLFVLTLTTRMTIRHNNNTVGLVYKRSVDISTENFSIALEEIISSRDPNIKTYIMGDFNINLLDYSTSPPVIFFLNLMISSNYYPVITRPTRVTPISCTLIDNIFCNRIDEIESTGVITTNISDHYPIFSRELRPSLADNVLSLNYRVYSD